MHFRLFKNVRSTLLFLLAALFAVAPAGCYAEDSTDPNNTGSTKPDSSQQTKLQQRPMIIWWGALVDDPINIELAVSSGIFSHAVIVDRCDLQRRRPWLLANFPKAVAACKRHNVKIIWTRWLYPSQPIKGLEFEDIFEASYYINRIRRIKYEAERFGFACVAFDAEPYANSPAMALKIRNLTKPEFVKLNAAIKTAVEVAGHVDFVIPEGAPSFSLHLYDATRNLGKLVIATQTYYDIPPDHPKKAGKLRPYDIFGAYVSVTKQNTRHPEWPLFTPREILQRQDLWVRKKGLMVFPEENRKVAETFFRIKTIRPDRATDPNSQ